jgi:photosystem II stability/assembly factor-like uncharacterized protein
LVQIAILSKQEGKLMNDSSVSIRAWLGAMVVAAIAVVSLILLPAVGAHSQNAAAAFGPQRQEVRPRGEEAGPQQRLEMAREEYERRSLATRRQRVRASVAEPTWRALGPTNGAGQMTSIAPHPTVSGTLYAGANNGGVWKTTDAGSTWVPLTDSIPSLEVGAVAVAPSNPNIIYVGTGAEPINGVTERPRGIGLLKSTDGGATWLFPSSVIATRFYKISVHPTNPDDLLIATNFEGYRSTDGGQTWAMVIPRQPGEGFLEIDDLARDPGNPLVIYASVYGDTSRVVKSTDGGTSWVTQSSGLPTDSSQSAIAIDPADSQTLYAATAVGTAGGDVVSHIYKTTNGGGSWVDLAGLSTSPSFGISHFLRDGRYHAIAVSPVNRNHILAGGINYVRSTDGGNTWDTPRFLNIPVQINAADMQYRESTLYFANAAGVWATRDHGSTGEDYSTNLVTRQYFSLTNDPVVLDRIYAGSLANGTDRRSDAGGTMWASMPGPPGTAYDSAVDPHVPSTAYTAYEGGLIDRARDAGSLRPNFMFTTPPYTAYTPSLHTRLTMDLNFPYVLYTINRVVWRTTNSGDSWAALPTTMSDGTQWDTSSYVTTAMAVAPSDSAVLMASPFPAVLRSTNGGTTWRTVLNNLNGPVNNIEIDPSDANLAYVATPGWDGGNYIGKLYVTTDGGATWTLRGSGLPDHAAIEIVRIDPFDSTILYCSTEIGVYRSTDRGFTWSRLGVGLPAVPVTDLEVVRDSGTLRAATFGRGVWEVAIRPVTEVGVNSSVTSPGGSGISNVSLILSWNGNQIAIRDSDATGFAPFPHLAPGLTYTVTPYKDGYAFDPPSQTFASLDAVQAAHFTAVSTSDTPTALNGYSTDQDGDGKSDLGFYRSGLWGWLKSSQSYSTGSPQFFSWGDTALPPICGDFDGDGRADIGYRVPPTGGQSASYAILLSSRNYSFAAGQPLFVPAGYPSLGDTPVIGDFDGDGKADPGLWRAAQGIWIIPTSSSNYSSFVFAQWGQPGDIPIVGDFDHDGKADIGFYRGGTWGVLQSSHNYSTDFPLFFGWGGTGLQPITADFDGDGRADIGYMVPPTSGQSAVYAILLSSRGYSFAAGQPLFVPAGYPSLGDTPVVGDFDGDGKADPGLWRESQGVWIIPTSSSNYTQYLFSQWGTQGDIAFPNSTGRH